MIDEYRAKQRNIEIESLKPVQEFYDKLKESGFFDNVDPKKYESKDFLDEYKRILDCGGFAGYLAILIKRNKDILDSEVFDGKITLYDFIKNTLIENFKWLHKNEKKLYSCGEQC
jgi:cyclopropane fatty-acyl-phospholipid synthase-like methyltransferase